MLNKENARYREKHNVWLTVLYYFVVICLVVIMAWMYKGWKARKQQFEQLVQEAALQDQTIAIEPRTAEDRLSEEATPLE